MEVEPNSVLHTSPERLDEVEKMFIRRYQKIADGKCPHRDHGDGVVALDFRILPCMQKRYCTDNRNDHHQRHFIGDL